MAGGSRAAEGGEPQYFGSGDDNAMFAATGMAFGDDWKNTDRNKIFTYDGELWLVRGEMSKTINGSTTSVEEGQILFADSSAPGTSRIIGSSGISGAKGYVVEGGAIGAKISYCNCGTGYKAKMSNIGLVGNYLESSVTPGSVRSTSLGSGVYGRLTEQGFTGQLAEFEFLIAENF